ncbi:DUF3363 domain-containing protein [Jannaschia sp. S6380]|uniref:relaxase/mobilization nuclease domain-containing protein n=1 Tax=Jannaschia sp. S6380 TaxID=2926408 RepID=UPI001FF161E4|nr:DUF3363 domain-containing protein [Jannaschia sp. S6380]MCK0166228.1 DUF3363 domain-containing protein [Jannaschia sp. S6380]
MPREDEFGIRPGRIRQGRSAGTQSFVAQALKAANQAGGIKHGERARSGFRSSFGRGGAASLRAGVGLGPHARRVAVKARVVRHNRRSAPLSTHLAYLKRDGVTRDGEPGKIFDANEVDVDSGGFATRCENDRHHFRFIVSPEDAAEISDLRTFTRDLMQTAETDLGTELDWIAVDHWNTAHPHVHVLVRGRTDTGADLVIARDYIGSGLRGRASERATLELGPRSDLEIRSALEREIQADRWTDLDRSIQRDAVDGVVDLRPRFGEPQDETARLRIGRVRHLERLGIAAPIDSGRWRLTQDAEPRLRKLQRRGDIIARLHDALGTEAATRGTAGLVPDGPTKDGSILGRLAARGLDDELTGSAFVVIDGVDGRTHHVALADLDAASDAPIGGIVEARWTQPTRGNSRLVVAVRSDFDIERQKRANGATWLDRQLVGTAPAALSGAGFGRDVRNALAARTDHLAGEGLATRSGDRLRLSRDLIATLRQRDLAAARERIGTETGMTPLATEGGEHISGLLTRRVTLASGRFAMIENGLGFQLVPWAQPLKRRIGKQVSGTVTAAGGIDWTPGRQRGPSV